MYTTQAVDLINGFVKKIVFSTTQCEFRTAQEIVQSLEKNSITIYDRLHGRYKTALAHKNAGNYYLVRITTTGCVQRQIKKLSWAA